MITLQGGDAAIVLGDYTQQGEDAAAPLVRNLSEGSGLVYFYSETDPDAVPPTVEFSYDARAETTDVVADGKVVGTLEGGNWTNRIDIALIPYDQALIAEGGIDALQQLLLDEDLFADADADAETAG